MATRAQILARAYAHIGIADYQYDVTPDERADARDLLDGMMAEWDASGVTLGYTASDGDDNDAVEMTTPGYANEPISTNLALRLAPSFGKQPAPGLMAAATRGLGLCTAKTARIPQRVSGQVPVCGAGSFYRRFGARY